MYARTKPETDRGTGRTTNLLRRVYDMLHDEQYPAAFFVVAHHHAIRYCVPLFCHLIDPSAKFQHASGKLSFLSKFGTLRHIYFTDMNSEPEKVRGYKVPIAHDHHVIEQRLLNFDDRRYQEVSDKLMAQGITPTTPLFIFKT